MLKRLVDPLHKLPNWAKLAGVILLGVGGTVAFFWYNGARSSSNSTIHEWLTNPAARPGLVTRRSEICRDAPFRLPTDGLIGLLWSDPAAPYTIFKRHTGIDIFGDGNPGEVPVYAAYQGYLTRLADWVSTVIIEHADPLYPGEKIWTYYTHMASRDGAESYIADQFPRGTERLWVEQGTLLGYQGEYNGSSFPIALHLHFSIVKSGADGSYLNEARIGNTLDPSPYLGLPVNFGNAPQHPIRCRQH